MKDKLLELTQKRRSIYNLGKDIRISKQEIIELVKQAVKYCPTAFNSQSSRIVILFDNEYQKFWDIVEEKLKKITEGKDFSKTKGKLNSFRQGVGTILFFEDEVVLKHLQEKYPLYKDKFTVWGQQSNAMLQYAVWMALAENNIGASLQHYNPIVDDEVVREWKLPKNWHLSAQMPFGSIVRPADEKTFESLDSRVKVFE